MCVSPVADQRQMLNNAEFSGVGLRVVWPYMLAIDWRRLHGLEQYTPFMSILAPWRCIVSPLVLMTAHILTVIATCFPCVTTF